MNIADHVKRLEKDLDLFEWRESGAPVWELARYSVALAAKRTLPADGNPPEQAARRQAVSSETISSTQTQQDNHSSIKRRVERFRKRLTLATKRNPLRGGRCDVVLFGHPRRKLENGRWIDLYADPVATILRKDYDVRFIEMDWVPHQKPEVSSDLRYIDGLRRKARRFEGFDEFSTAGNAKLKALGDGLHEAGFEVDLTTIVRTEIDRWFRWLPTYTELLQQLAPRAVVLVNSPHLKALVSAARQIGIPSIELQHGSPTVGKLNYDFPADQSFETFPDFFFCFGKFWTEGSRLPLPSERMPTVGFQYLRDRVSLYPEAPDAERRIMTISQPNCRAALAGLTLATAQRTDGAFELLWKNHPVEEGMQDETARALEQAGVRILPPSTDLYETIASAGTIIGGFSTALYESVAFGRRPQIVETGYEGLMSKLVTADAADLVRSADEMQFNQRPRPDVVDSLFATRSDAEFLEYFAKAIEHGPRL
ncbi:hypothetical protein [uncultured Roseibium sp.]|uniref:hypothetical protein n=1 Tax=uncultured Roseibium sp. TaxID=1936171 RepID=UPI00262FDC8B|nr:hypothetical protein [uncultured Roseibium sp.]